MNTEAKWLPIVALPFFLVGLAGCGGGEDEDEDDGSPAAPLTITAPTPPAAPTTTTGVFKDANVSGLEYSVAGGATQTTASDGSFSGIGQSVTFKLGGVTLGATTGSSVVTPIDLVTNGTSSSVAVQNIARFLLMLDSDDNSANGISISPAVRAMAPNWPQVDFATTDLPAALTTIISDVASVDARVPTLQPAATAKIHLESNFRCAYSGAFRGTFGGDDAGYWGLWITAWPSGTTPAGGVFGYAYSNQDNRGYGLSGGNALTLARTPTFSTTYTSSNTSADDFTVDGQFTAPDQITGTWTGGTHSGVRMALSLSAVHKIAGIISSGGVFVLNVDASNNLSGAVYITDTNALSTVSSGTLDGQTVNATFANGRTLTGTINSAYLLTGTSNAVTSGSGQVTGNICTLN